MWLKSSYAVAPTIYLEKVFALFAQIAQILTLIKININRFNSHCLGAR